MLTFSQFLLREDSNGQYVGVRFSESSAQEIERFSISNRISMPIPKEELHCTVIYSRRRLDYYTVPEFVYGTAVATKVGYLGNAIVLFLESPWLMARHQTLMAYCNGTTDFPSYTPHVSLSYSTQSIDINSMNAGFVEFEIEIVKEYTEDLKN